MSKISKDGAIEDLVVSSHKPINPVDKITIKSLYPQSQNSNDHFTVQKGAADLLLSGTKSDEQVTQYGLGAMANKSYN